MFVIDGHEDIAWSALTFGRDYTASALTIREAETRAGVPQHNGQASIGMEEWLSGRVGVIFASIFVPPCRRCLVGCDAYCYRNTEEAHQLARDQLDYYLHLADQQSQVRIVCDTSNLEAVVAGWDNHDERTAQIGLVLLMEGADPLRTPKEAEYWVEQGVRIIGPAWAGTRYSGGTGEPGPLTLGGRELLDVMAGLGLILDVSHMSEESFEQAIDTFQGTIIASHSNPRQIAIPEYPERSLSDKQIIRLSERGGVIGVVPYNRFLKTLWTPMDGKRDVRLHRVVEAVDVICQLTGSSNHVGIGSDFDGGFGAEAIPAEMDTVADLDKIGDALREEGYGTADVERVLKGNWLTILRRGLPE